MTPWHYRWLCQFAYINLPPDVRPGQTLSHIVHTLSALDARRALPCPLSDADREALSVLARTPELASLVLAESINRNDRSGLAACLLRAPDESLHLIFRGSESRGCGVPTGVDWLDNFLAPFFGSLQYPEIAALADRLAGRTVTFSGHSKGAHNALYALSSADSPSASAVVFNGQGFAPGQLSRPARARLARSAVNYVTRGDIVGSLLYHPERRVFVRRSPAAHPHALAAFSFDSAGQPLPALRPFWSLAVEWGTRAAARRAPLPSSPG